MKWPPESYGFDRKRFSVGTFVFYLCVCEREREREREHRVVLVQFHCNYKVGFDGDNLSIR